MRPRIVQAKAGKWVGKGIRQRKNWILRYSDMMLVYDTFAAAVSGLVNLGESFMVSPYGLVAYQLVPPPIPSRSMSWDAYDDDDSLSREELAQICSDCAEQIKCCFDIHAEMEANDAT